MMAENGGELERNAGTAIPAPPPMLPAVPAPAPETKEVEPTNGPRQASLFDSDELSLTFFSKLYHDLPIVSSSVDLTCNIYNAVRGSNCISYRMLKLAEETAKCVKDSTNPIVNIFKNPLIKIDWLLGATLQIVEAEIPAITLTPSEMYENTKWMLKYVCTGRCALDCVCKTGMYSLNQANNLKNMVLCKPMDDKAVKVVDFDESSESAFKGILDKINDPTSPFHQPIVPLMHIIEWASSVVFN